MNRPYQRGSVSLHNGNWTGRYFDCSESERVHKRVFLGAGLNKREARKKLESIIESLAPTTKNNYTLAEFVTKWEPVFQSQYKISSWSATQSILKSKILPFFGQSKLSNISPESVQTFVSEKGLSPASARTFLCTFRIIWKTAKLWGYVSHDPFEGIKYPRPTGITRKYFTEEDAAKILHSSREPFRTMYWMLAQTGMRIGECLALRWEDINFKTNEMKIERNIYKGVFQTPKSGAGFRTIVISSLLAGHLLELKKTWKANEHGLIFSTVKGNPCHSGHLLRELHATLSRLGIKKAGFHAFRHANATILDKIQAPMGVRTQRLGHANSKITLDIYTHNVDNGDVASRVDERLFT